MKYLFLIGAALLIIFFSYQKKMHKMQDFDVLMGEKAHILTKEDKENYVLYKKAFEKKSTPLGKIPKIIHFLWLKDAAIPKDLKKNTLSFIKKHPNYVCKIWSRYPEKPWHDRLQVALLEEEKEPLLAKLQILSKEGGVFVETHLHSVQSLGPLITFCDFFAEISRLKDPILGSSVSISYDLIAARKNSPLILQMIEEIHAKKHLIEESFPGKDRISKEYRQFYGILQPMEKVIQDFLKEEKEKISLFPSRYLEFFVQGEKHPLPHWGKFEQDMEKNLQKVSKYSYLILFACACIFLIRLWKILKPIKN